MDKDDVMFRSATRLAISIILLTHLSACDRSSVPAAMSMPPAEITVITVHSTKVAVERELPGRIEASRVAEVRARVSGLVEKRLFTEGAMVKKSQSLFQIETAAYKADYQVAQANVAKAQADVDEASYQAKRIQQLFEKQSVSELENIQASTKLKQAQAQLLAAQAALTTAKLNIEYTQVLAPIAGRIGRELITEGALVNQAQATPLAIIQQIDPVYINFNQDIVDVLGIDRSKANGQLSAVDGNAIDVSLVLPDGSTYNKLGKLLFSDVSVDGNTGQVALRAEIENPQKQLMPGMFVRVKVNLAQYDHAILLPQQCVVRSEKGDIVMVVDDKSVLNSQSVKVVGSYEGQWIITEGLKEGDKVLFEGLQKARPGSVVTTVERVVPTSDAGA